MSQSRAYQILDQGRVIRQIEEVSGRSTIVELSASESTDVDLTEAVTRDLKPHLAEVTEEIGERVAAGEEPVFASHGVLVPVTVDPQGNVLDGHHRLQLAEELGVPCPRQAVHAETEEERLAIAATLNADRRQMTDAQRLILGRTLETRLAALARERQAHGLTAPGKNALRQVTPKRYG